MTEKILRELIAINIEPIDFITIVASNQNVEYRLNYGWNGLEFKILITSSNSTVKTGYSSKSLQPIFKDFTEIFNQNGLTINHIVYVLNLEHGIFILNYYEGQEIAYTFTTKIDKIDTLNVHFSSAKEIINYAEASVNFNMFVNSLKTEYGEFKIVVSSLTPKELCRRRKLQKLFVDD